jgi:AraC family transcriptional regulator, exoenzyme S synthesis regulatory protein ExsA
MLIEWVLILKVVPLCVIFVIFAPSFFKEGFLIKYRFCGNCLAGCTYYFCFNIIAMYNLYTEIRADSSNHKKLSCGEQLVTFFTCPLKNKFEDLWSHYNYIVYVVEGRKVWHTAHGSYDLEKGSCIFVRSGASIVEQNFDTEFCFILFFMPDEFITDVLKSRRTPIQRSLKRFDPVIRINTNTAIERFFCGMLPHFQASRQPDQSLLDLKFRELILTIAENPANSEVLSCFGSMLNEPQSVSLQRVMEDNYCFNLKLEDFARLAHRSLSAFKRDFIRVFNTTPGKWLIERRLDHSYHLLTHTDKTVSETAFETGFESASHFSRVFRQRFGFPPVSMRRQKVA